MNFLSENFCLINFFIVLRYKQKLRTEEHRRAGNIRRKYKIAFTLPQLKFIKH